VKTTLTNYKSIAHLPHARRLLMADATSKAGDWIVYVAMSVLVFKAGGAGALSVFTALRVVVPFTLGPWAGRWGASLAPRTIMISADSARAVLLFLAAATAATGQSVWLLQALVVGCAALSAFHAPAERRFQRDVIDEDQRASFNAVIGATGTTTIVLAPAFGGLITAAVGNVGALVVDAVTFLISAALVASVSASRTVEEAALEQPTETAGSPALRKGALATALQAARKDPAVLACVVTQAVACTVAGASLVLLPLLASELHAGDGAVGWLTAAVGTGSVLGILFGGSVAKNGRLLVGVTSIIAMGAVLGLLGSSPSLPVAFLFAVLAGTAANIPEPMYWTMYADRVNEADSSSFYGLVESAITGGFALGGVILGVLATTLGTTGGVWVLGLAGSVLATVALPPAMRYHRQHTTPAPEPKVDLSLGQEATR
jgi:MFS family permease